MSKSAKVMSLRLSPDDYRRLHAYGVSKGLTDSAAARELIAGGLASDGLALYSTELGGYLRGVMQPLLEQLDRTLGERNAEQEDRIARVVHRATRASCTAPRVPRSSRQSPPSRSRRARSMAWTA